MSGELVEVQGRQSWAELDRRRTWASKPSNLPAARRYRDTSISGSVGHLNVVPTRTRANRKAESGRGEHFREHQAPIARVTAMTAPAI
jgi:hypothetical protein